MNKELRSQEKLCKNTKGTHPWTMPRLLPGKTLREIGEPGKDITLKNCREDLTQSRVKSIGNKTIEIMEAGEPNYLYKKSISRQNCQVSNCLGCHGQVEAEKENRSGSTGWALGNPPAFRARFPAFNAVLDNAVNSHIQKY